MRTRTSGEKSERAATCGELQDRVKQLSAWPRELLESESSRRDRVRVLEAKS